MTKKLLILLVSLIAFPTVTRTALIQTELTYNVRNAKGIYPFATYTGATGQINLANGNLVFSRPLISRPGRAGFAVDLSLTYNSKIWDRAGSVMTIPEAGSWVGLGWRIGFPKLVQGSSSYAVVLPDGSSHEIVDFGGGVWKSVDSSYILFDPATRTAILKGGVKLIFGNAVGATFYMTEMKDRNGNQVKATYVAGTGKLNQVQDTLGPVANFYYSADGMLEHIQSFGKTRSSYRFAYSTFNPSTGFSLPAQLSQGEKLLTQVAVRNNATDLRHVYSYDGYGALYQIKNQVAEQTYDCPGGQCVWRDLTTRDDVLVGYQYGTARFYDSIYGSVEERLVNRATEYVSSTGSIASKINYLTYAVDQTKSNPSSISILEQNAIDSGGTFRTLSYAQTDYTLSYTTNGRSWSDGLVQTVQRKTSPYVSPQQILRTRQTTWTQDNTALSFLDNPRVISQRTTLDDNQSTRTDFTYASDGTGNVRQASEYGFAGELIRSTTTNYLHETNANYANLNLTNLPASVSITDASGAEISRTEYTYDGYALTSYGGSILNQDPAYNAGFTTRGNPTSVRKSSNVTTSMRYDVAGNPLSMTDAKGNTTTTSFSSGTSYTLPQSVTNVLGHATSFSWFQYQIYDNGTTVYFYNGDLSSKTDPNGVVVLRSWYDNLGRKTQETTPIETRNYSYNDVKYLSTSYSSSGWGYSTSNPTGDQLDARQSDPGGSDIERTASYDAMGQALTQSIPFRAGGSGLNTMYTYDVLGRPVSIRLPNSGLVSYQYVGNTTYVTDPDGKIKKYTYNAIGRVSKVTEADDQGNLNVDTTYEYDALGRMTRIVQGVQTRAFTYDSLGRLISETHPESGTTAYSYDNNGNLVTKTDARGVVTVNSYDGLNRVVGRSYSDGTPSATFGYDETTGSLIGAIANGRGRQTSAWTSDGIGYNWSYDNMGRPVQQAFRIDGANYPLSYNYSDQGCGCPKADLQGMSYPDGLQINYTRDSISRIVAVSSPNPSVSYVTNVAYNLPNGGPSSVTYNPNLQDSYGLDPYGRLSTLHLQGSGLNDVIWTYGYTAAGRITQISEAMRKPQDGLYHSAAFNYVYDSRGRVSSASRQSDDSSTNWNLTFSYDRYGNLLTKQLAGAFNTVYTPDAATNRLSSYKLDYGWRYFLYNLTHDSAGYVTSDSAYSYSYNAMGFLKQVNAGQRGSYRYDALGRRVQKGYSFPNPFGTESGTITYVYGTDGQIAAEYKNGVTPPYGNEVTTTDNVLMNGKIIARRTWGTKDSVGPINQVEWLRRNHLGEVAVIDWWSVSYGGLNTSSMNTYSQPFTSGGSDQFPGQKEDPESKLKDFGARHFSATLARWTSADSILGRAYDPLSLNKYTYVRNDPVNYVDPDGRFLCGTACQHPPTDPGGSGDPNNWGVGGDSNGGMGIVNDSLGDGGGGSDVRSLLLEYSLNVGLKARSKGSDCANFLSDLIGRLKGKNLVAGDFSVENLIANIKGASININDSLKDRAITKGNSIDLGNGTFYPDQAHSYYSLESTLFHEGFHLLSSSATGSQLLDQDIAEYVALAAGIEAGNPVFQQIKLSTVVASQKNGEFFASKCGYSVP